MFLYFIFFLFLSLFPFVSRYIFPLFVCFFLSFFLSCFLSPWVIFFLFLLWYLVFLSSLSFIHFLSLSTHTHTHTHTYIYNFTLTHNITLSSSLIYTHICSLGTEYLSVQLEEQITSLLHSPPVFPIFVTLLSCLHPLTSLQIWGSFFEEKCFKKSKHTKINGSTYDMFFSSTTSKVKGHISYILFFLTYNKTRLNMIIVLRSKHNIFVFSVKSFRGDQCALVRHSNFTEIYVFGIKNQF